MSSPDAAQTPSTPTPAESARTLAVLGHTGALGTLARRPEGFPYTSIAPYAVTDAGQIVLVISDLAEHTRNLRQDPRCSLLVLENDGSGGGVLARGRLTVVGRARQLDGDEATAARARFVERHPDAEPWVGFGDFHAFAIEVESVRWIGGFGRMTWIRAPEWTAARPDPLAEHAAGIIEHMNDDHRDALADMVSAFGEVGAVEAGAVTMIACDRLGFDVEVETGARRPVSVRLGFEREVASPMEVRNAMVRLVKVARAQLGQSAD